jgi:hypothetical protein
MVQLVLLSTVSDVSVHALLLLLLWVFGEAEHCGGVCVVVQSCSHHGSWEVKERERKGQGPNISFWSTFPATSLPYTSLLLLNVASPPESTTGWQPLAHGFWGHFRSKL